MPLMLSSGQLKTENLPRVGRSSCASPWMFALLALAAAGMAASAQTERLSFETASVRAGASGTVAHSQIVFGNVGSLTVTSMPLRNIVVYAFAPDQSSLADFESRLRGGDPKLLGTPFDIVARAPSGSSARDNLPMLRSLLVDRFGLRFHYEAAATKGLTMSFVRPGVLGPNLKRSSFDCTVLTLSGVPRAQWDRHALEVCAPGFPFRADGSFAERSAGPIAKLAGLARAITSMPVSDATGMDGTFEWNVVFTRTLEASEYPTIYTAFREQLGLELKSETQTIQRFVIDEIHPPTDN
jgi:uncharacterized protein (TIGR03435 family)